MSQRHQPDRFELVCTLLGTLCALLIVAITLASPRAEAGQNWCGEYRDGYQIGYCWTRRDCSYIPPRMCPYPEDGQTDGFMVGLKEGLSEGKLNEGDGNGRT